MLIYDKVVAAVMRQLPGVSCLFVVHMMLI